MRVLSIQRLPTQLQTDLNGALFIADLEHDGIETRCRVCVSLADVARWPGHAPERLIEESLRFLVARVPVTSLLGCFELALLATRFPDYLDHMAARLGASP